MWKWLVGNMKLKQNDIDWIEYDSTSISAFCNSCHFVRNDIQDFEYEDLDNLSLNCICGGKYIKIMGVIRVYE